jgi:LysR family transcriptional regulator, carnitine catabolism transcriptional activator
VSLAFSKYLQVVDVSELATFMAVAELGSFRAAAAHLNLSQPSVTSRVQRLETALRTKLLVRTTRSVELTADGALLMVESQKALEGLGLLVEKFLHRASQARQRVTVAATPVIASSHLPALMRDYATRFTDVEVRLLDLRYFEILDALESGRADMAVMAADAEDERFVFEKIANDEVVLVVPEGHRLFGAGRIRVEELSGEKLMLPTQYEHLFEDIVAAMAAARCAPPIASYVTDVYTLTGMLDAGLAAALLSRAITTRRKTPANAVVHLDGVELKRVFSLVTSRKAELGTAAASFKNYLSETLGGRWPQTTSDDDH